MERIKIPDYLKSTVDLYFADNAKQLYDMVDKILFRLHFVDVDKNDFYSLANETFMYAVRDYDATKSFDGFLYSCLCKKFITEMANRKRDKRCMKVKVAEKNENGEIVERIIVMPDISLYTPIGDDENTTVGDMIADDMSIEKEFFEQKEEGYSRKMLLYLSKLSNLQKKVLKLSIAGYLSNEIREALHLTEKEYADCFAAIHSYRNVSLLF